MLLVSVSDLFWIHQKQCNFLLCCIYKVASLKNDITILQKKNMEIEIAQKVSEAVAEESRRCFQDLLQRAGIAKVTTGGIWFTSQARNGKRSDRSENDTIKRPRKVPRGFAHHRN